MTEIDTDYLVIGAGASAMAFVDALIARADVDVVMVDRRDRPGGHWLDAYPFVRLHQSSATYGVNSRPLGNDQIDTSGPNAGFYERASSAEICEYFGRVLDEVFVPSGRVRFMGSSEYRGSDADGHHIVSMTTGAETVVRVRRKFVDATYVESSIPSRHTPGFVIDPDVRFIPPNDLVDVGDTGGGFTVLGAGKTAMDTCNWLLAAGVDADRIRWVRPRDYWLINRAHMQPLDLVAGFMELQASWVTAAAHAEDGPDFAQRMEADGAFLRIDPEAETAGFRGAIISPLEVDALRSIERVVRGRRVRRVSAAGLETDAGPVACDAGETYVDCTAQGVRPTTPVPVFAGDTITLQYVTIGNVPQGAAVIGVVETTAHDEATKNGLCPIVPFSGSISGVLDMAHAGMTGLLARGAEPDVSAWNDESRLNVARAANEHMDDPRVVAAMTKLGENFGAAMTNLQLRAPLAQTQPA